MELAWVARNGAINYEIVVVYVCMKAEYGRIRMGNEAYTWIMTLSLLLIIVSVNNFVSL
jgi:hypothetical protein